MLIAWNCLSVLDDNKLDEDFFFISSSDIVGMVKQEFICQAFIMTRVVNF